MARVDYLDKAAKITVNIFNTVSKEIKPGVPESKIAKRIEGIIKKKGLKRSFKTIVASGPNAAKPHAKVTDRKIGKTDLVVVDFGVIYKGYHSDLTRTVIVGRISPSMRRLYSTVKRAQKIAIQKVRSGLKISDFVKSVHDHIRKKGFGKYILHSLGHGVGKKIHQAPKLSEKNKGKLNANIVVTIEPGLYVKGKCGVRIEDMIFIGKNTKRVLTK